MYQNDYRNGILVSVNHGGDSDTTGTITGAILGTIIGVHNIPLEWIKQIENKDMLNTLSDEICLITNKKE